MATEMRELWQYRVRMCMLDGVYMPVVMLAFGGDTGMDPALRYIHTMQSFAWAGYFAIWLHGDSRAARAASLNATVKVVVFPKPVSKEQAEAPAASLETV